METGFTLVFGGREFDPDAFLRGSSIAHMSWDILRRGETKPPNKVRAGSILEYADIHEGPYPLNVVREALDLLHGHRAEFLRLARDPAIEFRTLNFIGAGNGSFQFTPDDIELLHALGLSISIVVCPEADKTTSAA